MLAQIEDVDRKQDRLTAAYVDSVLDLNEYKQAKGKTVEEKTVLKERLKAMTRSATYWLEPTERFLNALFQATLQATGDCDSEKAKLLKKIGSNLKILDGKIQYENRGAWKYVEKHGRLA